MFRVYLRDFSCLGVLGFLGCFRVLGFRVWGFRV